MAASSLCFVSQVREKIRKVKKISEECLLIPGTLGNIAAIFLLTRPQIRTTFFNQLLTVLATWDLVYIVTMMLDAIEKLSPDLETIPDYTVMFPVLLYPLNNITMTGSIFTTVGVTLERFLAVEGILPGKKTNFKIC